MNATRITIIATIAVLALLVYALFQMDQAANDGVSPPTDRVVIPSDGSQ
ncbi:MAG: hypothetical protein KDF58_00385 [Alphaproteobacteria bacterium]|nr:hypothetical protein [Alphaproteobacteria bacterium]HPF47194.1 hypothetical protein [Emcibacteraceae bacterium]HRW30839.1 hypothetical protein [Emcibacteraceae bacterium]